MSKPAVMTSSELGAVATSKSVVEKKTDKSEASTYAEQLLFQLQHLVLIDANTAPTAKALSEQFYAGDNELHGGEHTQNLLIYASEQLDAAVTAGVVQPFEVELIISSGHGDQDNHTFMVDNKTTIGDLRKRISNDCKVPIDSINLEYDQRYPVINQEDLMNLSAKGRPWRCKYRYYIGSSLLHCTQALVDDSSCLSLVEKFFTSVNRSVRSYMSLHI